MTTTKSPLQSFEDKALKQFTKEITDLFFCYIQDDPNLMHDYLRLIGRTGDLDTTNQKLGKAVKSWFKLKDGKENKEPMSSLIESYTEHIKG
jgi:hypothetical protein